MWDKRGAAGMAAQIKAIIFRMPDDLYRRLVNEAKKARPKRSLSEEMRLRLERSLTLSKQEAQQLDMAELTDTGLEVVRRAEKVLASIKARTKDE
jgi:hypothetical protein